MENLKFVEIEVCGKSYKGFKVGEFETEIYCLDADDEQAVENPIGTETWYEYVLADCPHGKLIEDDGISDLAEKIYGNLTLCTIVAKPTDNVTLY